MSHTVYYVFDQTPKSVKIFHSVRDEKGAVVRKQQEVKIDFAEYEPSVGKPTLDPAALASYRGAHAAAGDLRHIAMLEVIPGGLCPVAAP